MTKIRYSGPEKRAYLRVSSRSTIKYAKLSRSLRTFVNMMTKSSTENICANGVKFIARKKIPVHTILEFQFKIPRTGKAVAGLGEVVRVKSRPRGRSYDVCLKFLYMQRKNMELIDAYVRKKRIQKIIKKL